MPPFFPLKWNSTKNDQNILPIFDQKRLFSAVQRILNQVLRFQRFFCLFCLGRKTKESWDIKCQTWLFSDANYGAILKKIQNSQIWPESTTCHLSIPVETLKYHDWMSEISYDLKRTNFWKIAISRILTFKKNCTYIAISSHCVVA